MLRILINKGYKVRSQWKVGYYRIDMVIEGDGKRLAVECDGDRWHPIEKLADDMARQAILERLGWTFTRIRGSAFFRDEEQAMRPVFERLDELGIAPGVRDGGSVEDDSLIKELEAIVREFHQDDKNEAAKVAANAVLAVSAPSPRKTTPIEPEAPLFTLSVVGEKEKLHVEVGDYVTYVDLAEPNYKKSFRIVADGHDPATGLVNMAKPIAQAFLGAAEGSVVRVPIADRPTKRFKLLKIERE